jgi:hypothetical protein
MAAQGEQELAKTILDSVNRMGFDNEEFIEELMNGHRTLQQSTARVFLECFRSWAKSPSYDLRNEATVQLAQKIDEATADMGLPMV